MPSDEDRQQNLADLRLRLATFDPSGRYLAASLLSDGEGWSLRFQTEFVGWPEGIEPGPASPELRAPGLVDPTKMVALWEDVGQSWIAVDDVAELAALYRLGGNAIIAERVAEEHLDKFIATGEYVNPALFGLAEYKPFMARPRPGPKLRQAVLRRDGYRCQLCGERPSLNEHIVLHVHHIKPFGAGGLTDEENLITMCHTCHAGLDPHEDLSLYFTPGGHVDRIVGAEANDAYLRAVEAYRSLATRTLSSSRSA